MPILEIESSWRETPLTCPDCGPEYPMYSDGEHWPQCFVCLRLATYREVFQLLISADYKQCSKCGLYISHYGESHA